MILATDLDGTFLGGTDDGRERLYQILHQAADATVIYVTGRGVDRIRPLIDDPQIPSPDYIIADVGATVVDGQTLEPIEPIQSEIEERWPGVDAVREALLSRFPDLRIQDVPQQHRLSFYVEDGVIPKGVREIVEDELGCDVLISKDIYLDVLPRGVSKGATLRALIAQKGMDDQRVVVAGDTLNDLSMFACDLKGIVVGEAEGKLTEQVREIGGAAYHAEGPGCDGIIEGLVHHGLLPEPKPEKPGPRTPSEERQLIMVYHRLPFDEVQTEDGELEFRRPKSPNGIIPTLLGFFQGGREGLWVAWSRQESREPEDFDERVMLDAEEYPNLEAVRVPLTKADVKLFYKQFSKEALWPVIFTFPERAEFDHEHWEHFLEINRIFAEKTAEVAKEGALVWVHDYNLWMVPHFLRELRPDVTIAFFHHTAFPSSDIFNMLPWRNEIIDSLLDCDYVGFHIPRYVENFADVVRTFAPMEVTQRSPCTPRFLSFGCALGIDEMAREIRVGSRTVRTGAHPVGINVKAIERILASPEMEEMTARLRKEIGDRKAILSVERLDYVKGPLEKLHAFELLLEQHPELHGEIVLITICTPAAPGMKIYKDTREQVDQAVGRINGRFSAIDWSPIRYFYRSLPYEEVIAHYAVSDIAWITPLRDGLNMVAKEYVAANHANGEDGCLVLSEFAGAAAEMHGALLTNPYDPHKMADDLHEALTMPHDERHARMATMSDIVAANNIDYWGYEFMAAVDNRL